MKKRICVMGMGYIGLPTASILATHGFQVLGVDIDAHVVHLINQGKIHIQEPGLRTLVQGAVYSGQLKASTKPEASDVFIIAVPTPCIGDPEEMRQCDDHYIRDAMAMIGPYIQKGNLIILESTSPPGTTEAWISKPLEEKGYQIGEDLFVAHCPERVLPGHILRELTQNDRVIGGVTRACAEKAKEIYETFVEGKIHLTQAKSAELVKLVENTFRDVNIALANELADICDHLEIDVREVIALANCHPRVFLHQPGPGVGGHCLPLDPWFIVQSAPDKASLIRHSRQLNHGVPKRLSQSILDHLSVLEKPVISVFGVAYKGNVDDARESPAQEFGKHLIKGGAEVRFYDPWVKQFEYELVDLEEAVRQSDALVIAAAHREFKYLDPVELGKQMRHAYLFDYTNTLDWEKWHRSGFKVIGRGARLY